MADFLKRGMADFIAQADLIVGVVAGSPTTYATTAAVMTGVNAELTALQAAEANVQAQKAALKSSVDARDLARHNLEESLREINRLAQAKPASPEDLAVAGLPVHDTTRTPGTQPTERADVRVEVVGQEHRLTFVDSDSLRPTRPAAARMTELYRAVVTPG
ncbi:MAG: hypothetical protein ACAI43_26715, partial [Phycisphaerae bacterium]